MANKNDPTWEYAGVKVPLQGFEETVEASCPVCHVRVRLGAEMRPGTKVECGLCAEPLVVVADNSSITLCQDEESKDQ